MINHRNKQNYRFRTWIIRDRCHLKGGVRQGCFLSLILNYLIQYIHFRSLYITSHYHAKFKENPCVGTDARPPLTNFDIDSYTVKISVGQHQRMLQPSCFYCKNMRMLTSKEVKVELSYLKIA